MVLRIVCYVDRIAHAAMGLVFPVILATGRGPCYCVMASNRRRGPHVFTLPGEERHMQYGGHTSR